MGFPSVQVGCFAAGIDAQSIALESERASWAAEKLEAVSTAKALKATLETITTKDGELNAAWATLAAARLKPWWMWLLLGWRSLQ